MPELAKRKSRRRNETRDLTKPILVALNKLPGVRVARNNVGVDTMRGVRYGLGNGSADLVGACSIGYVGSMAQWARVFCLEVKWPGKKPTTDQGRWAKVVRSLGGFVAIVHSVEEAIAAVARCREGASE